MRIITLVFCISFLASPAFAEWSAVKSAMFSMSPPPSLGSKAEVKDYEALLAAQEERTEEDCELSKAQRFPTFRLLYGKSELLNSTEFRRVEPLLERVTKLSSRVAGYFKSKFLRPRPYTTHPDIVPCVDKPSGDKSYPSSHATMAAADGCVLVALFPDRAKEILDYAGYLAQLRVRVGVHHPSDVAAGQKLGRDICQYLLKDDEFKAELARIAQD